ncbi:MAG: J domain-containing protein [Bacilli bacterium]
MKRRNHYAVLGIRRNADTETIREAYARRVRPYRNGRHPLKLQEITEAYETLKDPKRRARYDARLSRVAVHAQFAGVDEEVIVQSAMPTSLRIILWGTVVGTFIVYSLDIQSTMLIFENALHLFFK